MELRPAEREEDGEVRAVRELCEEHPARAASRDVVVEPAVIWEAALDPRADARRAEAAAERIPKYVAGHVCGECDDEHAGNAPHAERALEREPERDERADVAEKNGCAVRDEVREREVLACERGGRGHGRGGGGGRRSRSRGREDIYEVDCSRLRRRDKNETCLRYLVSLPDAHVRIKIWMRFSRKAPFPHHRRR